MVKKNTLKSKLESTQRPKYGPIPGGWPSGAANTSGGPHPVIPPRRRPTRETAAEREARYKAGRARGPEIAAKYGFPTRKRPPEGWVRPTGRRTTGRPEKKRKGK